MRSTAARLILVTLLSFPTIRLGAAPWRSVGPMGGAVTALAFAPSSPGTVYAGTYAGLFRSGDGGVTWSETGFRDEWIGTIAIDPVDENVVYVITSLSGAVYKSPDGGAHWRQLELPSGVFAKALLIDPRDRSTVYAGSVCGAFFKSGSPEWHYNAGVYKSADGGVTWNRAGGLPFPTVCVQHLALDPASPDTIYLTAIADRYARSDDGGRSWSLTDAQADGRRLPGGGVVIDPRDPRKRYGITGDSSSLLVSTDAGTTWSRVAPMEITPDGASRSPIRSTFNALTIDPHSGRLFLGTATGVYRSGDAGLTWLPLGGAARDSLVSGLAFDPATGSLTIGAAGGASRSGGFPWNEWNELAVGHVATSIETIKVDPSQPETLYALTPSRLYRSVDLGQSWEPVTELLPLTWDSPVLAADNDAPAGAGLAVDAGGDVYVGVRTGPLMNKLYKLEPGSARWLELSPPSPPSLFQRYLQFLTADPKAPGEIYVGVYGATAHTRDGGATWELLPGVSSLAIDPTNTNVLYTASSLGGISKSTDRGRTWSRKAPQYYSEGGTIAVSSADPSVLYLAARDRTLQEPGAPGAGVAVIARSTDGGETWTSMPSPAKDWLRDYRARIAPDPRARLTVYAAPWDGGVYRSTDGGATWQPFGGGFPGTATSLAIDTLRAFLHAGTGRGVWELPLAPQRPRSP